jgi:hypothetical protein
MRGRTSLVRVRQHEDGLWYPEVNDDGAWVPRYKAPFWRGQGFKRRGDAVNYFGPRSFEPHTMNDGTVFAPRYAWAPGEEPPARKPKKKKQDDFSWLGEPVCGKVKVK